VDPAAGDDVATGAATIDRTAPPGASETAADAGFADARFSDAGFARVATLALSACALLRVFADRVFAGCVAGSPRAIFAAGLALAIFAGRRTFAPPFIFATHNTLPLGDVARLQRV
jgi:hypothetical protein